MSAQTYPRSFSGAYPILNEAPFIKAWVMATAQYERLVKLTLGR